MPPYPAGSWERLGELLARRRVEISPRYKNRSVFAGERGVNWRLLYDLERAKRTTYTAPTIAAVEEAYDLAPGAIGRFLESGGALDDLPGRAPALPDPARLDAALERVLAPVPQEYWDSTDSDYAWLAPPERIERAKEIGRPFEISIWSNPAQSFTASQRRYAIALFRWQEAVAQGNHQQREADGLSRTPRPARIAIRSRLRLARAESAGIQYKKGS